MSAFQPVLRYRMAAVWRRMGVIMIGRTARDIAIVEAAARHPLSNALLMAIFIFPTARHLGPLVLRLFVRVSRDTGVIWTEMGTVWDANDNPYSVGSSLRLRWSSPDRHANGRGVRHRLRCNCRCHQRKRWTQCRLAEKTNPRTPMVTGAATKRTT